MQDSSQNYQKYERPLMKGPHGLTNENDRFSGEKSELNKELNKLTEWSNKLTESTKRLQNVRDGFDELKLG